MASDRVIAEHNQAKLNSLEVGRNLELIREYLHEMLVPHEHTYKRDNI